MKSKFMDQFVEHYVNDAAFRAELRSNPRAAVASRGITLDDDMLSDLESAGITGSGSLEPRISMIDPTNQC
jgi:hypothetical protein